MAERIAIECVGDFAVPVDWLANMCGPKHLMRGAPDAVLEKRIIEQGLRLPIPTWQFTGQRQVRVLDGFAFVRILFRLKEAGWVVPLVPVMAIQAETKKIAVSIFVYRSKNYALPVGASTGVRVDGRV